MPIGDFSLQKVPKWGLPNFFHKKNVLHKNTSLDRTVNSITEQMSLLEPFLMLTKELNPEIFGYNLEMDDTTKNFSKVAFILPGANKFYKNMKKVVGIDGAHIKPIKVIFLFVQSSN